MKRALLPIIVAVILSVFIYSCSSDDNSASPSVIQTPTSEPVETTNQYTLTVSAGEGGSVSSEGGTYDEGSEISIIATPIEGYEFVGWEGSDSLEAAIILYLSSNMSVKAIFRKLVLSKIQLLSPPDTLLVTQEYIPNVILNLDDGTTKEILQSVKISSQNSRVTILNNTIIGAVGGDEVLEIEFENEKITHEVFINNIEFEQIEEDFRSDNNAKIQVPVVIINIYRTNNGIIHNDTIAPSDFFNIINPSLVDLKARIKNRLFATKKAIELGTAYRDYGKNEVSNYISIDTKAYINIYTNQDNTYLTELSYTGRRTYNYHALFDDLNMEEIINREAVKEVWITEFPYGRYPSLEENGLYDSSKDSSIPESNMSSPYTGDISNSYRIKDDLPIYKNTYVVYGNSGHRGLDTNIHNRGHQIEAQLSFIEKNKINGEELFWNKFVGVNYSENGMDYYSATPNGRSGNTHHPPNADFDYDYCNSKNVLSDILNWSPEGGNNSTVNCETWSSIKYDLPGVNYNSINNEVNWLITWFQSIPGFENNIDYLKNGNNYELSNWWDLFFNWDKAIINDKTLWKVKNDLIGGVPNNGATDGKVSRNQNTSGRYYPICIMNNGIILN